ncbi:MAG: hypothetical protein JWN52_320 [Actinomycetia bacterium]|nr:hypothetical protein [Actinomycetes bacterium]
MKVSLEIEAKDAATVAAAIVGTEAARGTEVEIGEGILLRYRGISRTKGLGTTDLIMFALSFPAGITTGLIADAISHHFRGKGENDLMGQAVLHVEREVESIDGNGARIKKVEKSSLVIPLGPKAP